MTALHWQKSTYSEHGNSCVFLAAGPGDTVLLRESDAPADIIAMPPGRLRPLITRIKTGTLSAS
ncbi:DUF397 domain-containing protein [Streptomyces sp. URMC 124]|uniref:DUF397 domain-containing protein n=1 Tax=Streptomyces sp. URMC 124 TaxID=3423405 RepID=UPI003F1BA254